MRFCVSVPVLSEQIVVIEPSDSTATSLRISARRFNMRCAPNARLIVTTAGKPSGTAATARLTAVKNMVRGSSPRAIPMPKTIVTTIKATIASQRASPSSRT
jgi:hypothetical protein